MLRGGFRWSWSRTTVSSPSPRQRQQPLPFHVSCSNERWPMEKNSAWWPGAVGWVLRRRRKSIARTCPPSEREEPAGIQWRRIRAATSTATIRTGALDARGSSRRRDRVPGAGRGWAGVCADADATARQDALKLPASVFERAEWLGGAPRRLGSPIALDTQSGDEVNVTYRAFTRRAESSRHGVEHGRDEGPVRSVLVVPLQCDSPRGCRPGDAGPSGSQSVGQLAQR